MPGVEPGHELLALIQPYVRHCGDSHRPAWSMGPRKLLDFLLVYIAEGKGRFVIAGESYAAEPGDLFWIPPDTLHSMEGFAPGMHCPYVHFDLVYRPSHSHWDFTIPSGMKNLDELRPLLHERVRHPLLLRLKGRIRSHTNRRAGGLIQDICAEAARAQPFAGLLMSGMMTLVVAEILRGKTGLPAEQMAHAPFLEQAADIISRRCHENLRLREIAKSCELSASHFRFLFNRHFGMTPRAHLRRARLRRARELMVGTGMTLSEIALKSGFATVHSFSRAFRAVEGLAPREYRRCAEEVRTRVEGRKTPYSR
jgi:AraC-like DNA-binding protein